MKKTILICLLLPCLTFCLLLAIPPANIATKKSYLRNEIEQAINATGKAHIDLFLMSLCPYGMEAQKALIPILLEKGENIDLTMYFIATELPGNKFQSLHGEPEIQENRRQLVIVRNFPKQFVQYLEHRLKHFSDSNWSASALAAGLNAVDIERLVNAPEEVDAFRENIAMGNIKTISSSPSMFINEAIYKGVYNSPAPCKCDGGARDGLDCTDDAECPTACDGGLEDNKECSSTDPCDDMCIGGTRDSVGCNSANGNADCPGGYCEIGFCSRVGTCTNCQLPVSLIQFKGSVSDNIVLLTWKTASETNNKGFEIQHSYDGQSWKTVDFVEGNDNSNIQHSYNWTSGKLQAGIHYYRLKQVDLNGKFEIHNLVTLRIVTSAEFMSQAFPNPTTGSTSILVHSKQEAKIRLRILNTLGQEILQRAYFAKSGDNVYLLDLKHLPAGRLTVIIESNGSVKTTTNLLLSK